LTIFGEKLAFFSKTYTYNDQTFAKFRFVLSQKRQFVANFLTKIFLCKIIPAKTKNKRDLKFYSTGFAAKLGVSNLHLRTDRDLLHQFVTTFQSILNFSKKNFSRVNVLITIFFIFPNFFAKKDD
jgi:hypothetical protein